MKIFITGGSGLLGSKIAEIALEKRYKIYTGYCHNKPELGDPVKFDLAKDLIIPSRMEELKWLAKKC